MKTALLLVMIAFTCTAQPKPVLQPIPFSHKKHTEEARVKCLDCHTIRPPGDAAGFPGEAVCMGCHQSIERDSPPIQTLARYAAEKKPVPWVRVYKLPKMVYFSHEVHYRNAKVDCDACHGPVAQRDSLTLEKSINMAACMDCHDRYKASNDCNLCHDSH
jgi:hypothetical protein